MFNIDRRYVIAILIALSIGVFFAGIKYGDLRQKDADQGVVLSGAAPADETPDKSAEIQVYVIGEVEKPGLYKLKSGARVYEVLDMAGVLPTADLQTAQPARKLKDEETIVVYAKGQNPVNNAPNNAGANNTANAPASRTASSSSTGLVNINTATVQELDERLPGIGPALAQRIVDYRNNNGAFAAIEDINNVSGIGDKKFAAIKDLITVR